MTEIGREGARGSLIESAEGRIRVIFNTLHAGTREALKTGKDKDKQTLVLGVSSLFVRAMVDYVVATTQTDMNTTQYSEMYDNLLDAMVDKPGGANLS